MGLENIAKVTETISEKVYENGKKTLENITTNSYNIDIDKRIAKDVWKDIHHPINEGQGNEDHRKPVTDIDRRKVRFDGNDNKQGLDINKRNVDNKENEKTEKMQPPIEINFKKPEGVDEKEFIRQLKGQERGLNSQNIYENMKNRENYAEYGRNTDVSQKAQERVREKAEASRIKSNIEKGMKPAEARSEAKEWIGKQNAIHNPDQIAGGDPSKVSRMGDANVNKSIGSQWKNRVDILKNSIDNYAKDKSISELKNTKLNVKLIMEK